MQATAIVLIDGILCSENLGFLKRAENLPELHAEKGRFCLCGQRCERASGVAFITYFDSSVKRSNTQRRSAYPVIRYKSKFVLSVQETRTYKLPLENEPSMTPIICA
jgi:hypothetical protein